MRKFQLKDRAFLFFGIRFDVWKLGPVSKDLYIELSEDPNLLNEFIKKEFRDGKTLISPRREFSDDEFSDSELELLEQVSERFKYCSAQELINFTHRKESPWYITAQQHGLVETLESGQVNATNIEIDFTTIIADQEDKLARYKGHSEFLHQTKILKDH